MTYRDREIRLSEFIPNSGYEKEFKLLNCYVLGPDAFASSERAFYVAESYGHIALGLKSDVVISDIKYLIDQELDNG